MPMSQEFQNRLYPHLPKIIAEFGTPSHIYNERGIRETGESINRAFSMMPNGYRQFYAVKACPNPHILEIMHQLGFGFDCSSVSELRLVREHVGVIGEDIMFTANNTSSREYQAVSGSILNLDDISFIQDVPLMPELVCFRWNPGPQWQTPAGNVIGNPPEQKYGVPNEQIVVAYRFALACGAQRFGLHTMLASNCLQKENFVETARGLLEIGRRLKEELGITLEFINIGGGVGIPYRPSEQPVDLEWVGVRIAEVFKEFHQACGYTPRLFTEFGRIFAPNGILVLRVINVMNKYKKFIGVDAACTSTMMRPAIYYPDGGYHGIIVVGGEGRTQEKVSVVGPVCENCDQFARDRELPTMRIGDLILVEDTMAHCYAMASNYNGHLRPPELLLRSDETVQLIRRAETTEDLFATLNFEPKILALHAAQTI